MSKTSLVTTTHWRHLKAGHLDHHHPQKLPEWNYCHLSSQERLTTGLLRSLDLLWWLSCHLHPDVHVEFDWDGMLYHMLLAQCAGTLHGEIGMWFPLFLMYMPSWKFSPGVIPDAVSIGGTAWSGATCWTSICGRNLTAVAHVDGVMPTTPLVPWGWNWWGSCWTSGWLTNLTPPEALALYIHPSIINNAPKNKLIKKSCQYFLARKIWYLLSGIWIWLTRSKQSSLQSRRLAAQTNANQAGKFTLW